MQKLTQMRTLPSEMSLYLLMQAAMISVPPVDPLLRKTMARPDPVNIVPIIKAMNVLPAPRIWIMWPSAPVIQLCASVSMVESRTMA